MTELTGRLRRRAAAEGFTMSSAAEDGRLLIALAAAKPGGCYLAHDLLPLPSWTPDHQASVDELVARLGALPGWHSFRMDHGSGVMVCARSG
jgi:hypothetical protein